MFAKAIFNVCLSALLFCSLTAQADEGMWTFNNFPSKRVAAKYKFSPDQKWLDETRLASARIAGGCSASFVSAQGLVMTNHHCAHSCIEQLSTAKTDYVKNGYLAAAASDEKKCPEIEVNQLAEITDVTARLNKATKGLSGKEFIAAQKAEEARIEKECATSDQIRCDVVSLYHGGTYNLYKYRRYQDVRLVFAPELSIAFFGGDPDNFMFPRYDLDVSFLRVYENGKPAATPHFFPWSPSGAKEGDLTFVTGHPGRTSRLSTISELEFERDYALPERLLRLAELRGLLTEFSLRGAEQKRIAAKDIFYVENGFKALKGRLETLIDKKFFAQKIDEEKALRAKVQKNPAWRKEYGPAWEAMSKAIDLYRSMRKPYREIEAGMGFRCDLFGLAKTLVRGAAERPKPNEKRLPEFRDSALPEVTQQLFSSAPIYDDLEILHLTFALTKLRENLGADHPLVKQVLGQASPAQLATHLIKDSKLKDINLRKKLWQGGQKEIEASPDPMIVLARAIDPQARKLRQKFEDEYESVMKKNSELIAKARFAIYGQNTYPDATFTLRLSYGQVKGYEENGQTIKPLTDFAGAFARHTGQAPFALPVSWLNAKSSLDLRTPMNLATTNDIIGGNSGSPMINKDRQIVGLIFDGNIQSLGGDYGFDESVNRAVAVHSQGLLEALKKIYKAERLVKELLETK